MAFSDIVLRIRAQNEASGGLNALGNDFRRVSGVIAAAAGVAGAALGGMSAAVGIQEVTRVGNAFNSYELALTALTGSAEKARVVMDYLKTTSNRLGLEVKTTTEQFTQMVAAAKGTALQGQATIDIFESIAKAMTALGRSGDQTGMALNAVKQMISLRKVGAEELKEQLDPQLPGAIGIFAEALGMTTEKLFKAMEKGEVIAAEALPKVAAILEKTYGDAAMKSADEVQANINKVNNSLTSLYDTIFKSGFGNALNAQLKDVISALDGSGAADLGKSIGQSIASGIDIASDAAKRMKTVVDAAIQVARELDSELGVVDKMKSAFSGLSSAASSAAGNMGLVKAAIVGLVAAKATSTVLTLSASFVGLLAALNPVTLAIGAVIAGVGAAAAAIYTFRDSTVAFGDQQVSLGSIVSGAWTTISDAIAGRFEDIKATFSTAFEVIKGIFSQTATDAEGKFSLIGAAIDLIKSNFSTFVDGTKKGFEIVLGTIEYVKVAFRELAASIATMDFDRLTGIGSVAASAFGSQQGIIDRTLAGFEANILKAEENKKAVDGITDATNNLAKAEGDRAAQGAKALESMNAAIEAAMKNPQSIGIPGISLEKIQSATLSGKAVRPPDPSMIDPKLVGGSQIITPATIDKIAANFPSVSPLSSPGSASSAAAALGGPVIGPKEPDEDAVKAAEKALKDYQNRLERLTDALLPAKARSLEFKQSQTDLSRALKEGKISQEEYNVMTEQAQELMGSGSSVMAMALRDLDEQARLLGLSSKARETESAVIQLQNEARRDGVKLTQEEISLYRERYEAIRQGEVDSSFAESQKDRVAALREEVVLLGLRGAARERQAELFSVLAEAQNAGVSDATAATREYMAAYDELKAKEAEAKGSIMGGIKDALYEQVEAAQDVAGQVKGAFTKALSTVEEAFIKTALTGKFSFKDMTNSIHEDLLRFAVGGVKGALSKSLLGWLEGGTAGVGGSADTAKATESGIVSAIKSLSGASGASGTEGTESAAKSAMSALGGQSIGSAVINVGSATITGLPGGGGIPGVGSFSGGKTEHSISGLGGVNDNAAASSGGPFSFLTDMLSGVTDFFGGFFGKITSLFSGLASGLGNIFSSALSGIGSMLSGGGGSSLVGGIGSIFAGVFHTGGTAGNADVSRPISASVFRNANRYHIGGMPGLQPGEVPAILERGELVLTKAQTSNLSDMLGNARNDNGNRSANNNNSGNGAVSVTINQYFSGNVDKDDMKRSMGVAGQEIASTIERHRRRNG